MTKNVGLKTLMMAGAITVTSFSAVAATPDAGCCTSGAACATMINDLQKTCADGNASLADTCKVIKGLTQYEWLLENPDLSPLTQDQKNIAGTYQVKVGNRFVLTNKWLKSDAPGISSNGQNDITLKKICYTTRDVEISGKVKLWITFNLSFKSDRQSVQGKRGYFAEGGASNQTGRYFFSPVAADRAPIELP